MLWLIVYYLLSGDLAYDYVPPAKCIEDAQLNGGVLELLDEDGTPALIGFERAECKGPSSFGERPKESTGYGIDELAPIIPQKR